MTQHEAKAVVAACSQKSVCPGASLVCFGGGGSSGGGGGHQDVQPTNRSLMAISTTVTSGPFAMREKKNCAAAAVELLPPTTGGPRKRQTFRCRRAGAMAYDCCSTTAIIAITYMVQVCSAKAAVSRRRPEHHGGGDNVGGESGLGCRWQGHGCGRVCNCNRHSGLAAHPPPPSARHVVLGSVELHKQEPTLSSWDASPPTASPCAAGPLAAGRSIALVTLCCSPMARQCMASGTTRFAWVTQRGHPDPVGHDCRRLTWRQFASCLEPCRRDCLQFDARLPPGAVRVGGQLEGKNLMEHAAALSRLASQPVTLLLAPLGLAPRPGT
ncbi:hypothetical protein COCCADRAFT_29282 [Bipolaris zeicola 26-R-13]|uniref:Uncharacterized protein n=1 Tax=Cochliobolus carbonum (strain 26-R-13) TaxID=930089 RepID=W6XQL5_COCC2|nr:uncharacterized protein COCCADRAFT_29282 [Bipolaris zeicola 26-R-13]EUC29687.1 hypothetical protein COCCADRAFT_29282 [Bipolaris zeicola 26-R-13]